MQVSKPQAQQLTCQGMQAAVEEHAGKVAFVGDRSAMPASAAQVQAEASAVCVRALLIQGHDQQAMQLAQQVDDVHACMVDIAVPACHRVLV